MTQLDALDILKMGYNAFLTGPAGTGKTHLINSFIHFLKSHKIKYASTASTGIAATHIGGLTIHSWSGLGIHQYLDDHDIDRLTQNERLYKRWTEVEVLIIDEVSMLHGSQLDSLERLARTMRRNGKVFGGIQVVLIGDFFQLPPVTKDTTQIKYVFEDPVWKKLNLAVLYLTIQHRQKKNDALGTILSHIRKGSITKKHFDTLEERVVEYIEDGESTKLFTHNKSVDAYNAERLYELSGDPYTYEYTAKGNKALIETLKNSGAIDEVVTLKEGARVMCTKNNFEKGYVNGTIGYVIGDEDGFPIIRLTDGKEITIMPESWHIEDNGKVLAEVSQIPLRLAWAVTIHKSQGMTLDEAVIDLRATFTSGQGYVALSRVKSMEGLTLLGLSEHSLSIDDKVRNFDTQLQEISVRTEERLLELGSEEISTRIETSIKQKGGTQEEVTVQTEGVETKQSTYEKTLDYIHKKMTPAQIAVERDIKLETVISHFEHIVEKHPKIDLSYMKPDGPRMGKLIEKWKADKKATLSEMMNITHHEYSFIELRIARLFA